MPDSKYHVNAENGNFKSDARCHTVGLVILVLSPAPVDQVNIPFNEFQHDGVGERNSARKRAASGGNQPTALPCRASQSNAVFFRQRLELEQIAVFNQAKIKGSRQLDGVCLISLAKMTCAVIVY